MTLKESVKDLYGMLWQGRAAEAWDKYYADDLVRRNGFEPARVGKIRNQVHEQDFLNCVTGWKVAEIKAMAVDEDHSVTMVELLMEFTHKQWGDIRQSIVTVQRWRDGKIYDEASYVMRMEEASDRPMSRVGSRTPERWRQVSIVIDGKELTVDRATLVTTEGKDFTVTHNGVELMKGTSRLLSEGPPIQQDIFLDRGPNAGKTIRQIVRIEGDVMVACDGPPDGERPTEFTGEPGSGRTLSVWHRVNPEEVS
jgi:uncharacterized protein (TIGR03067 family)